MPKRIKWQKRHHSARKFCSAREKRDNSCQCSLVMQVNCCNHIGQSTVSLIIWHIQQSMIDDKCMESAAVTGGCQGFVLREMLLFPSQRGLGVESVGRKLVPGKAFFCWCCVCDALSWMKKLVFLILPRAYLLANSSFEFWKTWFPYSVFTLPWKVRVQIGPPRLLVLDNSTVEDGCHYPSAAATAAIPFSATTATAAPTSTASATYNGRAEARSSKWTDMAFHGWESFRSDFWHGSNHWPLTANLGNLAELMSDYDKATSCYESALRHNPYSIAALTQIASLCRGREQFGRVRVDLKRTVLLLYIERLSKGSRIF